MAQRNTLAHFLHDAGLAVWFGGTLAGAVAVNGAAADVDDPRQRARVANAGWARWTPVNAVAIGAHLVGGAQLLKANKGRVRHQKGVLANTNTKLALTGAALGATAYARVLGKKIQAAGDVPVDGATTPRAETPPEVAKAQKQLAALQWAIPALTGGIFISSALHEEQQRPSEVLRGTIKGLPDTLSHAAAVAGAAVVPAVASARAAATPVVKDAGERIADAAEHARDALSPVAKDAGGRLSVAAATAQAAIAPYAKEAGHRLSDVADSAKDAISPYADQARDAVVPYAKDAQSALAPYAKEAAKSAKEARKTVAPYVKDARDAAAPYAKEASKTAAAKAREAQAALAPYASQAGDAARSGLDTVSAKAKDKLPG